MERLCDFFVERIYDFSQYCNFCHCCQYCKNTFSVLLEQEIWLIWQPMWCSYGSVFQFLLCFFCGELAWLFVWRGCVIFCVKRFVFSEKKVFWWKQFYGEFFFCWYSFWQHFFLLKICIAKKNELVKRVLWSLLSLLSLLPLLSLVLLLSLLLHRYIGRWIGR